MFWTFLAIAGGAAFLLVISFIFGHDHDVDHNIDHGMDHDSDHDGHGGGEATISFFSTKVLCTLAMGFGASGAIATHYGLDSLPSSIIGIATGVILGFLMLGVLRLLYKQQGSFTVNYASAVGEYANVTVGISENHFGEIGLNLSGRYVTLSARALGNKTFSRSERVKIVEMRGNDAIVDSADTTN